MIKGKAGKIGVCAVRITGLSIALGWPEAATSEKKKRRPRQRKHGHVAALGWEFMSWRPGISSPCNIEDPNIGSFAQLLPHHKIPRSVILIAWQLCRGGFLDLSPTSILGT